METLFHIRLSYFKNRPGLPMKNHRVFFSQHAYALVFLIVFLLLSIGSIARSYMRTWLEAIGSRMGLDKMPGQVGFVLTSFSVSLIRTHVPTVF